MGGCCQQQAEPACAGCERETGVGATTSRSQNARCGNRGMHTPCGGQELGRLALANCLRLYAAMLHRHAHAPCQATAVQVACATVSPPHVSPPQVICAGTPSLQHGQKERTAFALRLERAHQLCAGNECSTTGECSVAQQRLVATSSAQTDTLTNCLFGQLPIPRPAARNRKTSTAALCQGAVTP